MRNLWFAPGSSLWHESAHLLNEVSKHAFGPLPKDTAG